MSELISINYWGTTYFYNPEGGRSAAAGALRESMSEPSLYRRNRVTTRMLAVLAIAAAAALVSGCSPGVDYPSLFPAVHDMPPPRADTTLDPVQVQQATEDLISARNHLNAEAPGAGQAKPPAIDPKDATAQQKQSAVKAPAPAAASTQTPAAGSTQTAGADAKP
ncbi:MAG: hypothetical protein ACLQFW_03410 [Xanthobacteraceae bacterium]